MARAFDPDRTLWLRRGGEQILSMGEWDDFVARAMKNQDWRVDKADLGDVVEAIEW